MKSKDAQTIIRAIRKRANYMEESMKTQLSISVEHALVRRTIIDEFRSLAEQIEFEINA